MKKLHNALFVSLIAFSTGACSSNANGSNEFADINGGYDESSAKWQTDVKSLSVLDGASAPDTMLLGKDHDYIWCKEWSWSDGAGPGLTVRYKYSNQEYYWENKYAGCGYGITKDLDSLEDPGEGWCKDFYEIFLPDNRECYYTNSCYIDSWGNRELTSIWYKEWLWKEAGVRCLTIRYESRMFAVESFIHETKYVGCRYIIKNKSGTTSESTSIQ